MPMAPAQYTYNDSPPPAPLRSYLFLLTIPFVAASWVVSLVSQSIVTARIGNSLVGPLWFAVILQFLTLLILFYGLLTNTLPLYHATLNTFTALIIVFAVLGVDRNIFNPTIPAQKALSAGWLILAILNSLWVIYFTTAPVHPASYASTAPIGFRLGPNRRAPPKDQVDQIDQVDQVDQIDQEPRSIPSIPTNINAVPSPLMNNAHTDSRPTSLSTVHAQACGARTRTQLTSTTDSHTRVSGGTRPDTHARVSVASRTQPTIPSLRSSSNTTTREGAPSSPTSPTSAADPAGNACGGPAADESTDDGGEQTLQVPQVNPFLWKAKALYPYTARNDPNELSFDKGEILEISDKAGKWWEGKKADGTIGIAPSNYLQLL